MLMNRNRFLITLLAVFAMVCAACNDDDDEKIGEGDNGGSTVVEELYCELLNNQDVNKDGGKFFWAVEASEKWTLDGEELPEWLGVEPLQGRAGTTHVVLEFAELTDGKARSFALPFVLGDETVDITVKQVPEGGVEKEDLVCRFGDNKILGVDGGELTRTLLVSESWTVTTDCDWLTVSPTSGEAGEKELTFSASPSGGILRVAVLEFALSDTVIRLSVSQSLNQTAPVMTIGKEAKVVGAQATLSGHCQFVNDELALEEIGFAYRPKTTETWEYLVGDLTETSGSFDFEYTEMLSWGTEYVYKPYAKLDGETYFGEEGEFVTENRTVEGGIWYYENFDGMYDPETKIYAQVAIDKSYGFNGLANDFETGGGYLRKNQPSASYSLSNFRININNSSNDGYISAYITPNDQVLGNWPLTGESLGAQFYDGASGNWRMICRYVSSWNLTISGLDFSGSSALQLTFGWHNLTNSVQPSQVLKVYVSSNGTDWTEITYTAPTTGRKGWRLVTVEDFPNTTKAIRWEVSNGGSYVCAIDDILVKEK